MKFYIKEAIDGNWSTRELTRAINAFSHQRYIESNKNHDVVDDTIKKEEIFKPQNIIKDPYLVL